MSNHEGSVRPLDLALGSPRCWRHDRCRTGFDAPARTSTSPGATGFRPAHPGGRRDRRGDAAPDARCPCRQAGQLLVGLVLVAFIFVPIERLFPLQPRRVLRQGWMDDVIHFFVNNLLLAIGVVAVVVVFGVVPHALRRVRNQSAVASSPPGCSSSRRWRSPSCAPTGRTAPATASRRCGASTRFTTRSRTWTGWPPSGCTRSTRSSPAPAWCSPCSSSASHAPPRGVPGHLLPPHAPHPRQRELGLRPPATHRHQSRRPPLAPQRRPSGAAAELRR